MATENPTSLGRGDREEGARPGAGTTVGSPARRSAAAPRTDKPRRPWTEEENALLKQWLYRATAAQHAHYYLMTHLRRRNQWLGIPVVVLSSVVGTSLFATLASDTDQVPAGLRVGIGMISVAAAVLAGVQTFLKFAERAERHGLAADWYSAVRREMEQLAATPGEEREPPPEVLGRMRKEMNKIVQTAPEIGEHTWHKFARLDRVHRP